MYDAIVRVIYYGDFMENFKNHINPFNFFKKEVEADPMAPKYIKPDGTEVIEQETDFGTVVYEIKRKDMLMISRNYDHQGNLLLDYARKKNIEIGHQYNELKQMVYEFTAYYDKGNILSEIKEISYKYHDNGVKSSEFITNSKSEIKTEILYDETGKQTEKIEYRGSVKTFFDANDKPYKREIDRGSGGIITEDL